MDKQEQDTLTVSKTFENREEAWEFMRQCDAYGVAAGYPVPVLDNSSPDIVDRYTVSYMVPTTSLEVRGLEVINKTYMLLDSFWETADQLQALFDKVK